MRKCILAVIVAFASNANAQLYLSGNFGIRHSESEMIEHNKTSLTFGDQIDEKGNIIPHSIEQQSQETVITKGNPKNNLNFGLDLGYYFSKRMAFGSEITYTFSKEKDANNASNWEADNMLSFCPYFRFDFVATEKVNFGVKSTAMFGFGKNKNNKTDNYSTNIFGFGFFPIVNYNFNSHWSATAYSGGLYYAHCIITPNNSTNSEKIIDNVFDWNLALQGLTIGVVYTF